MITNYLFNSKINGNTIHEVLNIKQIESDTYLVYFEQRTKQI